jgi:hypothetical protein
MNMAESEKNWGIQKSKPRQKSRVLIDNNLMLADDNKYKILRQLRIKLGKSKQEFHKILELYNHLVNHERGCSNC